MASKAFRARNPDAAKPMSVYYTKDIPDLDDSKVISRAVAQMPTGMEREEEMETHLQEAMHAQQASSSGHSTAVVVIPTPDVHNIGNDIYEKMYSKVPKSAPKDFKKVRAWQILKWEAAEYDCDSEDELWLEQRPQLTRDDLESMFMALENRSTDNSICLPSDAHRALSNYNNSTIDDVYEYWLSKRKAKTSRGLKCGLIPHIKPDYRTKESNSNPYVAFRRRLEKMQTRRNRKNEEETYAKLLYLRRNIQKASHMAEMTAAREKIKQNLRRTEREAFLSQLMYANQRSPSVLADIEELRRKLSQKDCLPVARKAKINHILHDPEIPQKSWLRKNAEVWNNVPFGPGSDPWEELLPPPTHSKKKAQVEEDVGTSAETFPFRPRRNCFYRDAHMLNCDPTSFYGATHGNPRESLFALGRSTTGGDNVFARFRRGRGGRLLVDRVPAKETYFAVNFKPRPPIEKLISSSSSDSPTVTEYHKRLLKLHGTSTTQKSQAQKTPATNSNPANETVARPKSPVFKVPDLPERFRLKNPPIPGLDDVIDLTRAESEYILQKKFCNELEATVKPSKDTESRSHSNASALYHVEKQRHVEAKSLKDYIQNDVDDDKDFLADLFGDISFEENSIPANAVKPYASVSYSVPTPTPTNTSKNLPPIERTKFYARVMGKRPVSKRTLGATDSAESHKNVKESKKDTNSSRADARLLEKLESLDANEISRLLEGTECTDDTAFDPIASLGSAPQVFADSAIFSHHIGMQQANNTTTVNGQDTHVNDVENVKAVFPNSQTGITLNDERPYVPQRGGKRKACNMLGDDPIEYEKNGDRAHPPPSKRMPHPSPNGSSSIAKLASPSKQKTMSSHISPQSKVS